MGVLNKIKLNLPNMTGTYISGNQVWLRETGSPKYQQFKQEKFLSFSGKSPRRQVWHSTAVFLDHLWLNFMGQDGGICILDSGLGMINNDRAKGTHTIP